jgi:hypothetical protein
MEKDLLVWLIGHKRLCELDCSSTKVLVSLTLILDCGLIVCCFFDLCLVLINFYLLLGLETQVL